MLEDFPLVIDPAENLLEVPAVPMRLGADGGCEPCGGRRWLCLHRLAVDGKTFPFVINSSMAHWFGEGEGADKSALAMIYDDAGRLGRRVERDAAGNWLSPTVLPDEQVGRAAMLPSLRLVFNEPGDAIEAMRLLETLVRGKRPAAFKAFDTLARLLRRSLHEPPRLLTVAEKDEPIRDAV